jgi:Flp pilus assembly protein TadG
MTHPNLPLRLRGWLRSTRGVAAVEFACAAPLLTILLIGTTELGLAVRSRLAAQQAVAAGAQSALKGFNAATIAAAVTSANPDVTIQATPAPAEFYACPAASGLTHVAENSTCADGKTARHYVDIWASVERPTVFGSNYGLPTNLTAHATARAP